MKIYQKIIFVLMLITIVGAVFIGNTRPIDDGDAWWQMAYGK